MRNFFKKTHILALALIIIFAVSIIPAYANSNANINSPKPTEDTVMTYNGNNANANGNLGNGQLKKLDLSAIFNNKANIRSFTKNGKKYQETDVTDKATILKIAQDIEYPNPESIDEMTVGIFVDDNVAGSGITSPDGDTLNSVTDNILSLLGPVTVNAATYTCKNFVYIASNTYFSNNYVLSALKNTTAYTATLQAQVSATGTNSYSCSVSADIATVVQATFGQSLGQSKTYTGTASVVVGAYGTASLYTYPFYKSYNYDVYNGTVKYTTGKYYTPSGGLYVVVK